MPNFSLFVDLARRALSLPRIAATPTSPICPLLLLPSATEGQANAILHCTVLTGDFGDRIGLKVANRTAVVAEIFDYVFFKLRRISAMVLSSVICSSCNLAR